MLVEAEGDLLADAGLALHRAVVQLRLDALLDRHRELVGLCDRALADPFDTASWGMCRVIIEHDRCFLQRCRP